MRQRILISCAGYFNLFGLCLPLSGEWAALGPFGGPVALVATSPASPGYVLAGTRTALLFESWDGGESWGALKFPAQFRAVLHALVMDPRTPGVYWAGLSSDLPQFNGILRTEDGGATWHQAADLRQTEVRAIAVWRGDSRILAAGTATGVFGSRDGGVSWTRLSPADNAKLQPIVSVALDPKNSATLYAGTPHLPWKTSDDGANWRSAHAGVIDDSDIFSLQVDRNQPQRLFAAACSGIYRSLNGGERWVRPAAVAHTAHRTYTIVQDPQYENVWFAGTNAGLIRTRNGGATWEKLASFEPRSIAFDWRRLGRMFVATDVGVLRSDDSGQNWQEVNRGLSNVRLKRLNEIDGAIFATLVGQEPRSGMFRLSPDSNEWELAPPTEMPNTASDDDVSVESLVSPPSRPYSRRFKRAGPTIRPLLSATSMGLRISDDGGSSWRPVEGELGRDTIQAVSRHPVRTSVHFVAKYGAIFASLNGGHSWKRISPDAWPVTSVKQILVTRQAPDRLLVLTPQQGVFSLALEEMRSRENQRR
jgi:photosystem II stability/assembly factor-like uncharacterized protein